MKPALQWISITLPCLWVLAVGNCVEALAPTSQPATVSSSALPEPPSQADRWKPPKTSLPDKVVTAVELLFRQGVSDPRGCEYCQVEVHVGDVWEGSGNAIATHGWVLPESDKGGQRFVVCWNGLVYPAASVGQRADLGADIPAIIALNQKRKAALPAGFEGGLGEWSERAAAETDAVSHMSITLLKVAMLLRAGQTSLAEMYWRALGIKLEDGGDDPYLEIAAEWAWYAFDRAVCAHMRGDDGLSLSTARLLETAWPKIEKTAAERGFKRPGTPPADRDAPVAPYIGFLQHLTELRSDEERRLEKANQPPSLAEAKEIHDQAKRIEGLILCLENVAARQGGQPGGVSLNESPIVGALEKEGPAAADALVACYENDQRLTRSVSFGRDFHRDRTLIPVANAAYVALGGILQTRDFGPVSDQFNRGGQADRHAAAVEIRAFWERVKGKSPAEGWYGTLADDHAQLRQWIEAASKLSSRYSLKIAAMIRAIRAKSWPCAARN